MPQPSSFASTLLDEASSVDTSPQRLQELFEADPYLGHVIASNPSASIQLLDQLASEFPAEVLANPALQLLSLEAEGVFGSFSLRSLVCLSLSSVLKQETQVLDETKRRMHEALDQLRSQELVGLSCVWLWRRVFTLRPQDCDGLIDQELELSIEHRAFVDGDMGDICSAIPRLACDDPDLVSGQRDDVFPS